VAKLSADAWYRLTSFEFGTENELNTAVANDLSNVAGGELVFRAQVAHRTSTLSSTHAVGTRVSGLKPAFKEVVTIILSRTSHLQLTKAFSSRGTTTRTFDLLICGRCEHLAKFCRNRDVATAIHSTFITQRPRVSRYHPRTFFCAHEL
jgi:hypothetical protein